MSVCSSVCPAHLQSDDPLVDVLPHAHLHIELRQPLVSLGARRPNLLAGGNVLGEVQHVPLDWGGTGDVSGTVGQRGNIMQQRAQI